MKFGILNKVNRIPAVINVLWSIFIAYQFIFRVPSFDNQHPDGASYFIVGIIIITGIVFLGSFIFIVLANILNKVKFYSDLHFVFIPIVLLVTIILLR